MVTRDEWKQGPVVAVCRTLEQVLQVPGLFDQVVGIGQEVWGQMEPWTFKERKNYILFELQKKDSLLATVELHGRVGAYAFGYAPTRQEVAKRHDSRLAEILFARVKQFGFEKELWYVSSGCTDPAFEGVGLGTLLMTKITKCAFTLGYPYILARVLKESPGMMHILTERLPLGLRYGETSIFSREAQERKMLLAVSPDKKMWLKPH